MEGTWFKEPNSPTAIAQAEELVEQNQHQRALAHLDKHLPATTSPSQHANATLLKSCIMRISKSPQRGLELAEVALYVANLNELQSLVSKAQLHRGLCLFDLGFYAEASWCFTRAASIRWFARGVTRLTEMAEKKRRALPEGSAGKEISPDFMAIPSVTSAKGFGLSPVW